MVAAQVRAQDHNTVTGWRSSTRPRWSVVTSPTFNSTCPELS